MKKRQFGIILQVLKILKEETDAEHLLTQENIVKILRQKGIICRRYTIEKIIDALKDFGYDIQTIKGVGTFLKKDGLSSDDVFVLLEGLNRANFLIENEYKQKIENKLIMQLNIFEKEDLKNKNMIL